MTTGGSKKIFIESSLFLAFIDRANLNHTKAVEIMEFLGRQKYSVYTSGIVILQTFNSMDRNLGSAVGIDFLQAIIESNIQILYPGESNFISVYRYLKVNSGRNTSFSAVINADIMQKHGISGVLTFDQWQNLMGTTVSNLIIA